MTTIRVKSVSATHSKEVDSMRVTVKKIPTEVSPVTLLKSFFEHCSRQLANVQPYYAHVASILAKQLEEVDSFSVSGIKKDLPANANAVFFCEAIAPDYPGQYFKEDILLLCKSPDTYTGLHWGSFQEEGPRHTELMAREACSAAIYALKDKTITSLSKAAAVMIRKFCKQDFSCKETFEYAYICYHGSHRRSYADISYEELVRRCDPLASSGPYVCREDLGEYISDLFK